MPDGSNMLNMPTLPANVFNAVNFYCILLDVISNISDCNSNISEGDMQGTFMCGSTVHVRQQGHQFRFCYS